jgi:hypothetical protein
MQASFRAVRKKFAVRVCCSRKRSQGFAQFRKSPIVTCNARQEVTLAYTEAITWTSRPMILYYMDEILELDFFIALTKNVQ